ncbi:MAG TPA: acetyl-CoA carboxylase biotin carboxyl carrier protein [Thermomicrobiales bacterium]|nr:acetyl-CoA carboxylase biotin carboxyl carrier protein [Thermomicrobiales bacterium]
MNGLTGHTDQDNQTSSGTDEVIDAVRELITMMSKGGISELDLSTGDVTIRLRGASAGTAVAPAPHPVESFTPNAPAAEPAGYVITAPMIGTYYSAPAPGEAPFVQIGDEVEVGQVIGIIEAMKIMNEIIADKAGVVSETLVENAQPVEYGSPLLRLTDSADGLG